MHVIPKVAHRATTVRSRVAGLGFLNSDIPAFPLLSVPLTRAAELPADFAADSRHFADDHQLRRRVRSAGAVDDEAFLGGQHRAAAAEVRSEEHTSELQS